MESTLKFSLTCLMLLVIGMLLIQRLAFGTWKLQETEAFSELMQEIHEQAVKIIDPDDGGVAVASAALLHKSVCGPTSPYPRRIQPIATVRGMPRAVKPSRIAARIWISAT